METNYKQKTENRSRKQKTENRKQKKKQITEKTNIRKKHRKQKKENRNQETAYRIHIVYSVCWRCSLVVKGKSPKLTSLTKRQE